MPRAHRLLLSLLAALGLLATLGWNATALACPLDSAAAMTNAHGDGCGHAPAPARSPQPGNPAQLCAVCIAVIPPPMQIAAATPPPPAPSVSSHQSLSGVDPGLDPPPPRAA